MLESPAATRATADSDRSEPRSGIRRLLADPRKIIGYSLLWGCGVGWWVTIGAMTDHGLLAAPGPAPFLAFVMLGYYTLCGWAGVSLVRGDKKAATLAILVQLPQLLHIQTDYLVIRVICGLSALVWWAPGGHGVHVGAASMYMLAWGDLGLPLGFAVNLIPVAILGYFWSHD